MPLTDEEKTRIAAHRSQYDQAVTAIRADPRLSPEGKKIAIAKVYATTRKAIRAVTDTAGGRDSKRIGELRKELFDVGSNDPSAVISYRDALDRAEQATTVGQAKELLSRAAATGDTHLAKAVLTRAWHVVGASSTSGAGNEWNRVIGDYAERYPEHAAAINEAGQLANAISDPRTRMHHSMYSSLGAPQELQHLTPDSIERMGEAAE